MSESVGGIHFDLTVETSGLVNANRKIDRELGNLENRFNQVALAAKALFAGLAVMSVIDKADQWGQYASRIKMATKSTEEYALVQDRMVKSANETYRSINETRESFIQLSPVMREMGLSLNQSIDAIDTFSGLLVVNAASGERASGAMSALSKSMQKGKIDADAWISIYSTVDSVVDIISASSGMAGEQIRKLGAEGKLSVDVLLKALVDGSAKVKSQVAEMPTTFRDALQNLNNGFIEYIGRSNEAHGITATLVKGVRLLGDNFELLADASIVAVAAGLARYTIGITAAATATAYKALTAQRAAAAEVLLAEAQVAQTTATMAQMAGLRGVGVTQSQAAVATTAHEAAVRRLAAAQAAQATAQAAAGGVLRTALSFLAGPAGIAVAAGLAAASFLAMGRDAGSAGRSLLDLSKPVDDLVKKFGDLNALQREQQIAVVGAKVKEDLAVANAALYEYTSNFKATMSQGGQAAAQFRSQFTAEVKAVAADTSLSSEQLAQAVLDLTNKWSRGMGWSDDFTQAMVRQAAKMVEAQTAHRNTATTLRALEEAAKGSTAAINANNRALGSIGEAAQKQIEGLDRQIALFGKAGTAAGLYYDLLQAKQGKGPMKDYNDTEIKAATERADKLAALEKKKAGSDAASKAEKFDSAGYLSGLSAAAASEWDKVAIVEAEAVRKADEHLKKREISQKEYEKAISLIHADAAKERMAIMDKEIKEAIADGEKRFDAEDEANKKTIESRKAAMEYAASLTRAVNPIDALRQELQAKLDLVTQYELLMAQAGVDATKQGAATRAQIESEYEKQRIALAEQSFRSQSDGNAFLIDSINALASTSSSAILGLLNGTMTVGDAMRSLGSTILSETVGSLVRVGVEMIKNALLADTLAAADKAKRAATGAVYAASVSAQVVGMAALAAQNAFAATAAIPIIGPGLAPAAAAAAGAAASALGAPAIATAPIAGARQYGGPASAGSLYRVNEGGAPEMFTASNGNQYMMPTKSGAVTPADQVGGATQMIVNVINNHPTAQVSTTRDNTGQIAEIVIAEISSQFQTNTGPVWRSLTSSSNVRAGGL